MTDAAFVHRWSGDQLRGPSLLRLFNVWPCRDAGRTTSRPGGTLGDGRPVFADLVVPAEPGTLERRQRTVVEKPASTSPAGSPFGPDAVELLFAMRLIGVEVGGVLTTPTGNLQFAMEMPVEV